MDARTRNIVILVAAVVIALVVVFFPRGDDEPDTPVGDPQSLETAQGEGRPSPDEGEETDSSETIEEVDLPDGEREAIMTTAEEFTEAWQSWSYEDDRPTEWASRAKELATDGFGAELDGIYSSDDGDNLEWKARQQRKYEQTTTAQQITAFAYDDETKTASLDVHMHTERESADGVFTASNEQAAELILVKDGDRWLVDQANAYIDHGEPSDDELGGVESD